MKILLTIIVLAGACFPALTQDSWKIYCGKKLLFSASTPDEAGNTLSLSPQVAASKDDFRILYKDEDPQKDWTRHIVIFNEQDKELASFDSSMAIPMKEIRALIEQEGALRIFTWSLPNDPDLAARIRIRRVHLCTVRIS